LRYCRSCAVYALPGAACGIAYTACGCRLLCASTAFYGLCCLRCLLSYVRTGCLLDALERINSHSFARVDTRTRGVESITWHCRTDVLPVVEDLRTVSSPRKTFSKDGLESRPQALWPRPMARNREILDTVNSSKGGAVHYHEFWPQASGPRRSQSTYQVHSELTGRLS
jgi:hypothetical protein